MSRLEEILGAYDWYDHPEGLKFVEMARNEHRTSGHFLYMDDMRSTFHRVTNADELWYIHEGRLTLYILEPGGGLTTLTLGADLAAGERPYHRIPVGLWQAAELPPEQAWAFGSVVVSPPFSFERGFEVGVRDELVAGWPEHRALIDRLFSGLEEHRPPPVADGDTSPTRLSLDHK